MIVIAIFAFFQFGQNSIPQVSAEGIFITLHFTPSVVDAKEGSYSIGFVNIANAKGDPILAKGDVEITLVSKNPSIATVVPKVVIPEGQHYANFDVTLGNTTGDVEISATFEDQIVSQNLIVGSTPSKFPDSLQLEILTPTTNMHVNTEMPLSVLLKSSDGTIIPAAEDIVVTLDYEESLIKTAEDKIIIKKGNHYGITTLTSLEDAGNSFVRATVADLNLSAVTDIKISSTTPSKLQLYIFPSRVTEFNDNTIEIFVGLEDINGFPTVATKDVTIGISADNDSLSDRINAVLKNKKPIIKKGEFGFHVQPVMVFTNLPENYTISVSSDNYQSVSKLFDVVEPMKPTDGKAKNKAVNVFVPSTLPTGAKAIVVYQTGAVEDDDDPETEKEDQGINVRVIDDLKEGEIFPVQTGRNYYSTGSDANLKITSSDDSILSIVDAGFIRDTKSLPLAKNHGIAIITTGKKTGDVTVSVSLDGWGSGKAKTSIVNPLEPTQTIIFSPVGSDKIILDENGGFELFVLPLDSAKRPTSLETGINYLIKPINELTKIQPRKNFVHEQFFAEPGMTANSTNLNVVQVGVDSDPQLEATINFEITRVSTAKIILPFERLISPNKINPIGTVQLIDYYGNPIQATKKLSVSLSSSNEQVLTVPKTVTIPAGSSFAKFPISVTSGATGTITISSNTKIMQGSSTQLFVETTSKQLKLFVQYPETPIDPNQEATITVFVDDEKAKAVKDALITLLTSDGAQAIPDRLSTSDSGQARFIFKAQSGPTASLTIKAAKVGYADTEKTLDLQIRSSEQIFGEEASKVPPMIIYVAVGIAVATAGAVAYFIFIKPKQQPLEEVEGI